MPRSIKPTSVAAPSAPVATTEKLKKVKSAPAPAAPAPVAPAPVVSESVEVDIIENVSGVKLVDFGTKLQAAIAAITLLKNEYKVLEKSVNKELKAAQKASSRKKKSAGNRQPSGFVKPTLISNELAEFLGKPLGTEMARTDVSKEINAYIRSNFLQDKTNGRKIVPDAKLGKLLKLSKDDELTYFNLQRYMKHHFVKATPATA